MGNYDNEYLDGLTSIAIYELILMKAFILMWLAFFVRFNVSVSSRPTGAFLQSDKLSRLLIAVMGSRQQLSKRELGLPIRCVLFFGDLGDSFGK